MSLSPVSRRLRGIAGAALLWAAAWLPLGVALALGSASAPAVIMAIAYFRTGPRVVLPYVLYVAGTATLGAVMAAGSLALARRAPAP